MTDSDNATPDEAESTFANRPTPADKGADKAKGSSTSSKVWKGTAVGIGSAALVAALMYAKRRK